MSQVAISSLGTHTETSATAQYHNVDIDVRPSSISPEIWITLLQRHQLLIARAEAAASGNLSLSIELFLGKDAAAPPTSQRNRDSDVDTIGEESEGAVLGEAAEECELRIACEVDICTDFL